MAEHKLDHRVKKPDNNLITYVHDYDVDVQSNHIYLFGIQDYIAGTGGFHDDEPGVEYVMANRFIRNLNICMRVNPERPVLIHMKTCGGDWTEGMAIHNAIKSCPYPVTILSYTHARSMSSLIFQAANKRVMMPDSYFMYHDGTLGVDGTVKQVESAVDFNRASSDRMLEIYIQSMSKNGKFKGKPTKQIRDFLIHQMDKKEDVYLDSKTTVEHGLADEIFNYNWAKLTEYSEEQLSRG